MNEPTVSVIMPVLNEESSVVGAIRSALAQRDVEIEVLVVDGRSADRTAELVREIAAADPRVRLLDNPAVIIPAALNVGLAAARGRFIARVDGHASVSEDYLARAVAHLDADPKLGSVGGLRTGTATSPSGRAVALALSSPFGVGDSVNHFGTEFQLTDHASFGVTRTDVARAVGGWDETLLVNEDVDFDHRILAGGHTIAFDPQMRFQWHVRESPRALLRQYRRYGRGKAAMVRKNGREAIRARHLAAPVAVVGTAALAALATWSPRLAVAGYAPYLIGVAGASVAAWRGRDAHDFSTHAGEAKTVDPVSLPLSFMAMHYGWGLGFLEGYVLRREPQRASGDTRVRSS